MDAKTASSTGVDPIALVLTTLSADTDAAALGRILVDERLAACVNVLPPMTSIYRWKNGVEQEREQQIVIKTMRELVPQLEARLRALHPYEVPEFLVVEVAGASHAYRAWLVESLPLEPRR